MRARSYKFKFDSGPSTTANVFRSLDVLEVNPVSASMQRAQRSTLRCEMRRYSILNAFTAGKGLHVCQHLVRDRYFQGLFSQNI